MGVFLYALTAMPLLISPRLSAGQLTPVAVTMDAGTLSVSLREARLHDVMEAIARLSGIEFVLAGQSGQMTVTDSFQKLSLEDGLRRLLKATNYMFIYSATTHESRLARVFVIARRGARVQEADQQIPSGVEGIRESLNRRGFTEAVAAALAAAGGMRQEDQGHAGTEAAARHFTFQHLLPWESRVGTWHDRFQRLLQPQLQ
jgi:type II secretory pathway component GspD/PulD (secretin)